MTSDQIFKQLEIEDSDDAYKATILSRIMTTADLRFARVVDEIMSDKDRKEFETFSEGKEPQDIVKWIDERYEGISELYTVIIESIIAELKSISQQSS